MCRAAVAAGADGLIIEVTNDRSTPDRGAQSITPVQSRDNESITRIAAAGGSGS